MIRLLSFFFLKVQVEHCILKMALVHSMGARSASESLSQMGEFS